MLHYVFPYDFIILSVESKSVSQVERLLHVLNLFNDFVLADP